MNKIYIVILSLFVALQIDAAVPFVVLHTNDTHSQIEPYGEDDKRNAGKAGILRREVLIREIRQQNKNVFVFDVGDFVQGTPYFNFFKGRAEVELMNYLKPDAVTLGNHEFDNGIDFLVDMIKKAKFPVVCTNYDLSSTPLNKYVKPWLIIKRGGLNVGVVSANINPKGLISAANYEGMKWLEPISKADEVAGWLKKSKGCDIVICLSHLGYEYDNGMADDKKLAAKSKNIDVILGGHTHTFMRTPEIIKNAEGEDVVVNQSGKGGIQVGRLDFSFELK
jgi:5'-nucleotidase